MAENNLNNPNVPSRTRKTYAEMVSYTKPEPPPVEKFKDLRPIVKQRGTKSRNVGKVSWWNDALAAGKANRARGQEIGIAPGQEIAENAAPSQGNDYPKEDDLAP